MNVNAAMDAAFARCIWRAGADGIAHAVSSRNRRWTRTACGRVPVAEQLAWPERSRCPECCAILGLLPLEYQSLTPEAQRAPEVGGRATSGRDWPDTLRGVTASHPLIPEQHGPGSDRAAGDRRDTRRRLTL